MEERANFRAIISRSILDVTERVGGIELRESREPLSPRLPALVTCTKGDYSIWMVCRAAPGVLLRIAENMKRGPVNGEQGMKMYCREYFNILCGSIVSRINREEHLSARFGIPEYQTEAIPSTGPPELETAYECPEGQLGFQIFYTAQTSAERGQQPVR